MTTGTAIQKSATATAPAATGPASGARLATDPRPPHPSWWARVRSWLRWLLLPGSRNGRLLAGVAVGFAVLQLTVMGLRYGYGWDESVYLSMVDPAVPDALWSPWRAWGTALVAFPVGVFHAPLEVVRGYLIMVSSASLFLAFRVWLTVRDEIAVPIAALLFSTVFVTVYYGVYAMPNYYVAVGAVALVGLFVRLGRALPRRHRTFATVALGAVAAGVTLVRPSDSAWVVAPLLAGCLVVPGWRRWRIAGALVAGEVLGWLPWLVEAYLRFGGPRRRWELSRDAVGGGLPHLDLTTVKLYLRMSGGKSFMCYCADKPAAAGPVNPVILAWWTLAALAVVAGLVLAWRRGRLMPSLWPVMVAASVGFPYFFLLEYAAVRFLLPALALAALPAARALAGLAGEPRGVRGGGLRDRRRLIAAVAVGALLVIHTAGQLNVLRHRMPSDRAVHAVSTRLDEMLRDIGFRDPCVLIGQPSPMLVNYLGCTWDVPGRLAYLTVEPPALAAALAQGRPAGVLVRQRASRDRVTGEWVLRSVVPADSYLSRWQVVDLPVAAEPGWQLFLPPQWSDVFGAGE